MGNLGRMGYGGTLDGMWPYSYDSCDSGTLPNQTMNGEHSRTFTPTHLGTDIFLLVSFAGVPEIATTSGPEWSPFNGSLSYLTGQRLSACTCPDDPSHPGPKKANGDWTGRSAPEIDLIEAQVCRGRALLRIDCSVGLHLAIIQRSFNRRN